MSDTGDTRTPFTAEETEKIRKLMNSPGSRLICPRCQSPLSSGTPVAGGGSIKPVFKVQCKPCQLIATLMD